MGGDWELLDGTWRPLGDYGRNTYTWREQRGTLVLQRENDKEIVVTEKREEKVTPSQETQDPVGGALTHEGCDPPGGGQAVNLDHHQRSAAAAAGHGRFFMPRRSGRLNELRLPAIIFTAAKTLSCFPTVVFSVR